jgi:LGFP repeat
MKAQTQVWVWGDGGEQLVVLNGPVASAEFDIVDFVKSIGTWVADYFGGKWVQLAKDVGNWLQTLGGDVKAQGAENESFAQGGTLYNGDPRLASYAHVFFHAWTGDDIKPSHAGVEPPNSPGIIDLGEVRYTRGDFQYEYRFLIQFSLLTPGKYSFAFATGDSGEIQDATIAYTVGVQIDDPKIEIMSIQQKYDTLTAHGWFDFGQATTDESAAPDGIGRYRHYQNGSLYWSPGRGAHLVLGAIRQKWQETGWETGFGYPLTDELPTPDGIGRFNHFQGASIYCTRETGAHEVHGAIREKWASLGWERSYLGYPITDEVQVGDAADTRYSNFQGGSIRWTPRTGAMDYHQQVTASQ